MSFCLAWTCNGYTVGVYRPLGLVETILLHYVAPKISELARTTIQRSARHGNVGRCLYNSVGALWLRRCRKSLSQTCGRNVPITGPFQRRCIQSQSWFSRLMCRTPNSQGMLSDPDGDLGEVSAW